jgi:hypothetical protein
VRKFTIISPLWQVSYRKPVEQEVAWQAKLDATTVVKTRSVAQPPCLVNPVATLFRNSQDHVLSLRNWLSNLLVATVSETRNRWSSHYNLSWRRRGVEIWLCCALSSTSALLGCQWLRRSTGALPPTKATYRFYKSVRLQNVGVFFFFFFFVRILLYCVLHPYLVLWFSCVFYLQLTYSLHGAESFLRSQNVLSYSRNSPHFMEPEGS